MLWILASDCRSPHASLTLGLQVCTEYLLWALKYVNMTYLGLFGALGLVYAAIRTGDVKSKIVHLGFDQLLLS